MATSTTVYVVQMTSFSGGWRDGLTFDAKDDALRHLAGVVDLYRSAGIQTTGFRVVERVETVVET